MQFWQGQYLISWITFGDFGQWKHREQWKMCLSIIFWYILLRKKLNNWFLRLLNNIHSFLSPNFAIHLLSIFIHCLFKYFQMSTKYSIYRVFLALFLSFTRYNAGCHLNMRFLFCIRWEVKMSANASSSILLPFFKAIQKSNWLIMVSKSWHPLHHIFLYLRWNYSSCIF